MQTLQLHGIKTNATTEWTPTERNLMLYSGSSTYTTNTAGDVFVERPITTYRENNAGVADDSYLDVMTVATAMYFRSKQRSRILSRYPRHKLAKDGTNFAPGQAILTPKLFKSEMFGLYRDLELAGIVQDFDNYKTTFVCSIDPKNPTRINYQDQPIFVNGLIIVAGKIQFRKN
ncbi:phage tail sheath C-terminal domain-containing protein [Bathymodiolus septemdierum thioautotrophic gill symbiont]|uniref:phage tail sheath C-terminal domain-containing protein n=1 Tax=Bathymodiolus septemdierum thioautotrophic gill symbiont TaxID=113267 RepID=UPI002F90E7DD